MREANERKNFENFGSVLDHTEELPTVRRMRVALGTVEEKILLRAPSLDILDEITKLENDAKNLKFKIWENHLKGCFIRAVASNDNATAEDTLEKLARFLSE